MLVSDRMRKLFVLGSGDWKPPKPWIEIRQDTGALLLVSPDGKRFHLVGPCVRFVQTVESDVALYSLLKTLGRDPSLWPENTGRIRK